MFLKDGFSEDFNYKMRFFFYAQNTKNKKTLPTILSLYFETINFDKKWKMLTKHFFIFDLKAFFLFWILKDIVKYLEGSE